MMRRVLIAAVVFVAIAGGVAAYVMSRPEREWTTRSPEALEAFRRGMDADRKLYKIEALEFYETALALDPDFVMARLQLLPLKRVSKEELKALRQQIETTDTSRLTPRERFIVSYTIARWKDDQKRADAVLDDYLAKYPKDSTAIGVRCQRAWMNRDFKTAVPCYERLLEIDPNWVLALNHLGYIALAEGRFADAEEAFRKYRFVAPDQANPHDSLGELLTLVGRYEEAEKELEEALAIRPDFCPSLEHLIEVQLLRGDYEKAARTIDRVAALEACATIAPLFRCKIDYWRAADGTKWTAIADMVSGDCPPQTGDTLVLAHLGALRAGRRDVALGIESKLGEKGLKAGMLTPALALHLEGTRLALDGQHAAAAGKFREADAEVPYWGDGQGVFKLYNQIALADALYATGEREAAERTVAGVRKVSPPFEARFASHVRTRFSPSR